MKSGQRPREQLSTPLCSLSPSAGSSLAPRETRWLQAAAGCAAEAELDLLESWRDSSPGLKMLAAQVLRKSGASVVTSLGAPLNGGGEGQNTNPFPQQAADSWHRVSRLPVTSWGGAPI